MGIQHSSEQAQRGSWGELTSILLRQFRASRVRLNFLQLQHDPIGVGQLPGGSAIESKKRSQMPLVWFLAAIVAALFQVSAQAAPQSCEVLQQESLEAQFTDDAYAAYVNTIKATDAFEVALGFFAPYYGAIDRTSLKRFAYALHRSSGRTVITWKEFNQIGLAKGYVRDERPPNSNVEAGVSARAINKLDIVFKEALARPGAEKVIDFNLDRFDPEFAFGEGLPPSGVTGNEVYWVLSHPEYFVATRWFLNRRELSPPEVERFFGRFFPANLRGHL